MGNLATKGTTTSQSTQTGGNSSVNTTSGNPTDLLTKIVTELYGQTAPHREEILSSGLDFLQGNYDYSASPMWGASKAAAEDQYGLARENLMENLPTGGSLNQGLTDIAGSRARTLTDEASKIAQDEYNKIYGYATGMPSTAIQGLGTAAGLENALSVAGIYSAAGLAGQKLNAQAIEDAGKNEAMGDIGYGLASSDYGSK